MEEILEKEADAENTLATDRKRVDNVKAVDTRNSLEQWRACVRHRKGSWVMKIRMYRMYPSQKSQEGVVGTQ